MRRTRKTSLLRYMWEGQTIITDARAEHKSGQNNHLFVKRLRHSGRWTGERFLKGHEERKLSLFGNKTQSMYEIWKEVWSDIGN